MSLIRAILRSDLDDLTIVTYGGPDVGLLCRAGKVRKVVSGFVSLDSVPLEPNYQAARQEGTIEAAEWDEGMLLLGLQAAAWRLPFLPTRAGLGSDVVRCMPDLRTVTRHTHPRGPAGRHRGRGAREAPRRPSYSSTPRRPPAPRTGRERPLNREDPFDDLFVRAAERACVSCSRSCPPRLSATADVTHLHLPLDVTGV